MRKNYFAKLLNYMKNVYHIERGLSKLTDKRISPTYNTGKVITGVFFGFLLQIKSFNELNFMIINGELNIINFNRWGYDDPYEEFNRLMVFTRRISISFAKGQIDGYFDDKKTPEIFFRRMVLYIAINAHFSVIWSIPFGEEEVKDALERAKMSNDDYKGFTTIYPEWY